MKFSKKRILFWCFSIFTLCNLPLVLAGQYFTITKKSDSNYKVARPKNPALITERHLVCALAPGNELDDPFIEELDLSECENLGFIPALVGEYDHQIPVCSVRSDDGAASSSDGVSLNQMYAESHTGLPLENDDLCESEIADKQPSSFYDLRMEAQGGDFRIGFKSEVRRCGLIGLRKLTINGCINVRTVADLSMLKELREVSFCDCSVLDVLPRLPLVRVLLLRNCKNIEDLSCLSQQSHLNKLDITECEKVIRVDVSGCEYLRKLDCTGCRCIRDISSIAQLSRLEGLVLDGCIGLTDISFFRHSLLDHLTTISFRDCVNISDFSDLASLPQLLTLNLRGDVHTDGIGRLTNIERLRLEDCEIIKNLSFLKGLEGTLQNLFLGGCSCLQDVSILSKFTELGWLDFSCCLQISDLSFLENAQHNNRLEMLSLCGCKKLRVLPNFSGYNNLKQFYLDGCTGLCCQLILPESLESLDLQGLTLTTDEVPIFEQQLSFVHAREVGGRPHLKHCVSIHNLSHMCPGLRLLNILGTNLARKIDKNILRRAATKLTESNSITLTISGVNGENNELQGEGAHDDAPAEHVGGGIELPIAVSAVLTSHVAHEDDDGASEEGNTDEDDDSDDESDNGVFFMSASSVDAQEELVKQLFVQAQESERILRREIATKEQERELRCCGHRVENGAGSTGLKRVRSRDDFDDAPPSKQNETE